MYLRYFLIISAWKRVRPFIWTNLNPLHPRTQECFVPSLVEIGPVVLEKKRKCEKFMISTTMADNWQSVIRKAHLSLWLRWADVHCPWSPNRTIVTPPGVRHKIAIFCFLQIKLKQLFNQKHFIVHLFTKKHFNKILSPTLYTSTATSLGETHRAWKFSEITVLDLRVGRGVSPIFKPRQVLLRLHQYMCSSTSKCRRLRTCCV